MSEINDIKKRLFAVIPTSSLHMMEFLKLMDIRFSEDETASAAITCSVRPELILNKSFIDTYCQSNEHLFMLVMHELYHIILGHTHLFKRHSEIDNIAFDAVINAMLCRMFPGEEYVSFFQNANSEETFPSCILRPLGKNTPAKFIPILKNLYLTNTGTYFEVYECILKELKDLLQNGQYLLLGNHSRHNDDMNNPLLKRMFDEVITKWPKEMTFNGRDLGGELEDKVIQLAKADRIAKNKMKRLLRKSGVLLGNISKRQNSTQYLKEDAISLVPDYKDRTLLAKSLVYQKPLLYHSTLINRQRVRESNVCSMVYLDVSGSVVDEIRHFAPLLLKPYQNKECLLFTFSTTVTSISYQDFRDGKFKSTGGTSLDCIFKHYFSLPKHKQTKKILILTDGDTGQVSSTYYQKIKASQVEIYCGLFGNYTKDYLLNITKYFEEF